MLSWRNYADLVRDTMLLAPRLAHVDTIAGLPRSGMLPASILATALHKPLGFVHYDHGGVATCGVAGGERVPYRPFPESTIALVDDSVLTGRAMAVWADQLPHAERACVYLQPGAEDHVDHFAVELPAPRIFQWNLFGSELVKHSMLDIDGVLCPDPPMPEDDESAYREYLAFAPVLHRPLFRVAALATNRLEKYRATTTTWLALHGIEYGELHMAPFETASARRRMSTPADLKSAWYAGHEAPGVFIESHDRIAEQVAVNVGKPVISLQSMRCFQ